MDVWREAGERAATTALRSGDSERGEVEPIDAETEAARWKFYYRDPGCVFQSNVPLSTSVRQWKRFPGYPKTFRVSAMYTTSSCTCNATVCRIMCD
eukprot:COSAG02_NODE_2667_length_8294_cov_305.833435_4_plen_96_part_00